jgi:phenylacetate-coenzyme A ligase PaaK-like adenylate-forming protein
MTTVELNALLVSATTESGFYRRFYGMREEAEARSIRTIDEWRSIPLLSKRDLLGATMTERSFLPMRDVDYISSSSGTTGSLPLFSPRTQISEYGFRQGAFQNAVLASTPVPHQQELFLENLDLAPRVIVIDPRNPAATARLAKAAGVDAIFAFLFHVPLIAEHLVREGVAEQITCIELTGESPSRSQLEQLERIFPNAVITACYGTSEVENSPMGVPCKPISSREPLPIYHPKDGIFIELLDADSQGSLPLEAGTEGELVITAYRGEPAAFPFIRYRTGDKARIIETECARHNSFSFAVVGRIEMDFVKLPGGMLQADEIERALRSLPDTVEDTFEAHVFEQKGNVRIVLRILPKHGTDLETLAQKISSTIRISPDSTYADAAARGLVADLECEQLEQSTSIAKRKRIVRHFV